MININYEIIFYCLKKSTASKDMMPICSCDIFFVLFLKLFPFTPISLLISFKPGFSGFLKGAPIVFFTPFFCIQLVEVKISEVNLLISSNLGKINPLVLEYLEEFFLNKFSDFLAFLKLNLIFP